MGTIKETPRMQDQIRSSNDPTACSLGDDDDPYFQFLFWLLCWKIKINSICNSFGDRKQVEAFI